MPRNFAYVSAPSTPFNSGTADAVLPLETPGFAKLYWANFLVTIDRSIITARIMNLQLRDGSGNVLWEIPSFVGPSPQQSALWPVFFNGVSSNQPPPPIILPPGASFRLYDTRGISGPTDSAAMTSALFEF